MSARTISAGLAMAAAAIAVVAPGSTLIVIDLRRYERWVLDAHAELHRRGIWSAGLTDSMLSPIASKAEVTFVVTAGAVGPFDSHVGTLGVLNLADQDPPRSLKSAGGGQQIGYDDRYYDPRGRTFYVKGEVRF